MQNYKRLKFACYTANITMSIIGTISPLLFLTFRNMYGISYSLLGLLVLINFSTQLLVDLIFSFFSHKFNISFIVKSMPIIAVIGLVVYALSPILFQNAVYVGLVLGTIIFSASSGLAEVLISPVIASIPSDNPEREMSKLHSIYAWGVVGFVITASLFLLVFGNRNWQLLAIIFTIIPLTSAILYLGSDIPQMQTPKKTSGALKFLKDKGVWLCVFGIFLGGAAECTMAQWSSGYLEQAFNIPKIWGDVFGVALFAAALGTGRSLYAKIGKNVPKILFLGAIGSAICYLVSAFSPFAIVGLIGCACTGFCVSMLWPGSLIVASDKYPNGGVLIFALMAAGGDAGASVGPQLVGIITDVLMVQPSIISLSLTFGITAEQLAMKMGMLVGAIFPIIAILVYARFKKKFKTN